MAVQRRYGALVFAACVVAGGEMAATPQLCAGLASCLEAMPLDAGSAALSSNASAVVQAWAAYLSAVYGGAPVPADGAAVAARVAQLEWLYRCIPGAQPYDPFDNKAYPFGSRLSDGRLPPPEDVRCTLLPPNAPTSAEPRIVSLHDDVALGEAYVGAKYTDGLQAHARFGIFVRRRSAPAHAAENAWIEVARVRNRFEGGRLFLGTWYYVARGTGVFLNVGRTYISRIRYPSHAQQRRVIERSLRRGYETVQYKWVWRFGAHELVDLRAAALSNVGLTCAAAGYLRAGARTERACNCSEAQQLLNCGEALDRGPRV
jgi:hypothetical protein